MVLDEAAFSGVEAKGSMGAIMASFLSVQSR